MNKQIAVGIGVIILRDDQVLLMKRKGAHGEGEWGLPGGKLDLEEKIRDCAKREVKEELSLVIKNAKVISVDEDFEYLKKYGKHYITIGCLAKQFSGDPKIMEPQKCSEIKWFDLKNLPISIFEPSRRVLNCFLENKCNIDN